MANKMGSMSKIFYFFRFTCDSFWSLVVRLGDAGTADGATLGAQKNHSLVAWAMVMVVWVIVMGVWSLARPSQNPRRQGRRPNPNHRIDYAQQAV